MDLLCAKTISHFERLYEEKLMIEGTSRSPKDTEKTRRKIVPNKVYNIGDTIQIILNSCAQSHQEVTLKCRENKPIRFTYEEFTKFTDFVYKFMDDDEDFIYGFIDCVVPDWFDFVIGQYIFLSCWKNEKAYGLAIQDTKNNNDYVIWNENEIAIFMSHKYKLYEFLK
ncbi:hypothetical protein ABEB36_013504 [Hypothenemus hampei]|uniref:Uncharacterized protein n=1 Tax=Hypothenemus hampei TaxID=57062 RepID=A0ABD1E8Y8_HYPHA